MMIYSQLPHQRTLRVSEHDIEDLLIRKLEGLKYTLRPDIRDWAALETNFREKFEALNRVHLTDPEFARLLDEIITPDVFTASKTLRSINSFTRDDGTPLNYSMVNLKDWCKNHFEVVNQLRINTDNSHHRYDVLLLINGVPCVQIELKTLGVNPRRAMEQIVEYKNQPGNGYTKTLLCFMQLFIVSNRDRTYYFANNNGRHFAFNAEERFLPVYEFADEDNRKITHLDEFADRFLKKCDLGRTISRYMVLLASEQRLMIMRPAEHFVKGKRQNQLTKEHIFKIIDTYQQRPEKPIERYARRVEMAEIEQNNFNLNISRYISTAVGEEEIDLAANHQKLVEIETDIVDATKKHNAFLVELGLPILPQ